MVEECQHGMCLSGDGGGLPVFHEVRCLSKGLRSEDLQIRAPRGQLDCDQRMSNCQDIYPEKLGQLGRRKLKPATTSSDTARP